MSEPESNEYGKAQKEIRSAFFKGQKYCPKNS
jgi:hypothetical protein